MIRTILGALLLGAVTTSAAAASLEAAGAELTRLLGKYVTHRGVRYAVWRSDGDDLKAISAVVASIRGVDVKALAPEERKAVFIDLYNARVIEIVLQGNPKQSIKQLKKVFERKGLLLGDKGTSLNEIEKMLRDEFKDPRVHFALNRASRSSPPLLSEAYHVATLDRQLDEATRSYLAIPGSVTAVTRAGKTTILAPRIFDWYEDDFRPAGGPMAFLAKYGPPEVAAAAASGNARLEFTDYDWSLNSAP